jgi:tRNA (cytidine/uridine-2'-O-)-methyltransferase
VHLWPNWEAFEKQLPDLGEPYFFSARASRALWDAPLNSREGVVLVFGKESTGLSAELCERYRDRLWGIPMLSPMVRSLNLSTSVGIVLYEVLRKRLDSDGSCR